MNRLSGVFSPIVGIALAFFVIIELMISDRSLNNLAIYLAVGAFILSVINPRRGFLILLCFGCYLESLKFGAWWQNSRYLDMMTLNLPPIVTIAGICVGSLFLVATRQLPMTKANVLLWMGAICAGCLLGVKTLLGGGGEDGSSLGDAANASAYLMLVPTTVMLFNSKEECLSLLSKAIWCVLPASLYGIYQAIFGYPEVHYDFMADYRGWIYDINSYIQPVGTMNGPIPLGTVSAISFGFIVVRSALKGGASKLDWLLGFAFVGAAVLSGRRSSILLMLVFVIGVFFFKTPRRAVLLYLTSLCALASLYLFANPLIYFFDNVNKEAESMFGRGTFVSRMANVGTFNERLLGFRNMTRNPDLWSFFGSDVSEKMGKFGDQGEDAATQKREGNYELLGDEFVHDGLNRAIISYGVVPLFILGLLGVVFLFKVHQAQFSMLAQENQRILRVSVALMMGIGSVILTSQQAITIQPVNLFVFMWAGLFITMLKYSETDHLYLEEEEQL